MPHKAHISQDIRYILSLFLFFPYQMEKEFILLRSSFQDADITDKQLACIRSLEIF